MLSFFVTVALRGDQFVTIRYRDPAKEVAFAGDTNLWNPTPLEHDGRGWAIRLRVPADARFEYKLVVDRKWILDPANPKQIGNGLGGVNSVYEGPAYHPARYPDGEPKHPMKRLQLTTAGRKFVVFAPNKAKGLPIMVYADGESYETAGRIQRVYENLAEASEIRPVVLVLVPPKDRMTEYGAGYASYAKLLFDSILPMARKATGASERPEDLYLGGSSMGGVIALRLAEEYPDKVQGGVHSQSGAFQFAPLNLHYEGLTTRASPSKLAPRTRLWLCWGNFESTLTAANQSAAKTLREMHRRFGSKVTNEGHNWTAWRNRMVGGVTYLFGQR